MHMKLINNFNGPNKFQKKISCTWTSSAWLDRGSKMKIVTGVFSLIIVALIPIYGISQKVTNDSLSKQALKENKAIMTGIEKLPQNVKDSVLAAFKNSKVSALNANETVADFITFLPIALFLLILFTTMIKLKKDKVKLSDFLIDKDTQVALKKEESVVAVANTKAIEAKVNAIKANPQVFANESLTMEALDPPTSAKPTDDEKTDKKEQSTSRLVAFISGITSVSLAACITSFYFYRSFSGETNPGIGNLATVLYGLGLGVLPYGFNKIANSLK